MHKAILLITLPFVFATDFYITSPYAVTNWEAGKVVKITWDLLNQGPEVKFINVDLMDGDDSNAHVVTSIAKGLSTDSTSTSWVVPNDFPRSSTVFVRVSGQNGNEGHPAIYRFSHRFSIFNPSGEKPKNDDNKAIAQNLKNIQATTVTSTETIISETSTGDFGDLSSRLTLLPSDNTASRPENNSRSKYLIEMPLGILMSILLVLFI